MCSASVSSYPFGYILLCYVKFWYEGSHGKKLQCLYLRGGAGATTQFLGRRQR